MTHPPGPRQQQWYGQPQQPPQIVPPQPPHPVPPQSQPGWSGQPGYASPPPGWSPPGGPPGPPAVIDLGKVDARRLVRMLVALGVLGLSLVTWGVVEAVTDSVTDGLVLVGLGLLFLLLGMLPVFKGSFRPRRLVIGPAGLQWDDPKGKPWSVPWGELAAVGLHQKKRADFHMGATDAIAGTIVNKAFGEVAPISLELFPADPGFHQRHPQLAHLWAKDRLRLKLSFHDRLLPQVDAAIRYFQPSRYLGIRQST